MVPLIIEVQLDDSAIQSGVEKLKRLGQIDEGQAVIFKKTNEQIATRATLFQSVVAANEKLTFSISPQQAAYNKLNSSLTGLFGTSKAIATELLKLGSQTLFQGLKNSNLTIDQFILKLKAAQVGTLGLETNMDEVTQSIKDFVAVANTVSTDKLISVTGGEGVAAQGISPVDNSIVLQKNNDLLKDKNILLKETIANTQNLTEVITPQQEIYNKLAESVQNLTGASKEAALELLKLSPEDLAAQFGDAGVTTDQFAEFLRKAADGQEDFSEKSVTVTTRLNEIKNQMAALEPLTDANRAKIAALAAEGGRLTKSLNESRGALKTFGSESPVLTAATNVARGLTGAFQAGAAAATLFGEKNTALEEVLVKVFQITSITQGIQEVLNAVNQKGSITVLQLAFANEVAAVKAKLLAIEQRGTTVSTEELAVAQEQSAVATKEMAVGTDALAAAQARNAVVSKEAAVSTEVLAAAQTESAIVTKSAAAGTELLTASTVENAVVSEGAAASTELLTAKTVTQTIAAKAAAAAQVLLNLALKTGPVGIVIALVAAVGAMAAFALGAAKARKEVEDLNTALEESNFRLSDAVTRLKVEGEQREAVLKENNAKESTIALEQTKNLVSIQRQTQKELAIVTKEIHDAEVKGVANQEALDALDALGKRKIELQGNVARQQVELDKKSTEVRKILSDEELQQIRDLAAAELSTRIQNSRAFFAAERVAINAQLAIDVKANQDNEEKKKAFRAKAAKDLRDIDAAEVAQQGQDRLTSELSTLTKIQIESRRINSLIFADETAQQNKIIQDDANIKIAALEKEGEQDVSVRQRNAIKIIQIQRDTQLLTEENNRQQRVRDITRIEEDAIARNNVIISSIKTTNKERLNFEIENELDLRVIALADTSKTEDQKRGIIAQSEEKIRTLRRDAAEKELNDSLEIIKDQFAGENREIQRQLDAQAEIRQGGPRVAAQLQVPILNIDDQVAKIQQLTNVDLEANATRKQSNAKLFLDGLKSQEDFVKDGAALDAERTRIIDENEEKIRRARKATADFSKTVTAQVINESLQGVAAGLQIVSQLYQQQDQAAQARLDAQRKRIQEELDAGEITTKAAMVRNKELDAQTKQLQREQARRNKELAIFQAIIGTAQAVINAAATIPFIPLGLIAVGIAAALGAAQIAVIQSAPLPSFYKGKNEEKDKKQRDQYEGWAEVGERGPEIWKSGSQTKLIEKSTIVWIKKGDIIYNASQTAAMKAGQTPTMGPMVMNTKIPTVIINNHVPALDYKKLGELLAKKSPVILNIDGYKDFIQTQKDFTEKLNDRRKWQ